MKLDYYAATNKFVLCVSRDHGRIKSLMREDGLDFAESISTAMTAALCTDNPYAAAGYYEYATPRARGQLKHILPAIESSWVTEHSGKFLTPQDLDLWPYQKGGVAYALQRDHSLIGDEPGLGKTPMSIVVANERRAKRVLVICPANIRLQWAKQIRAWSTMEGKYLVYPILKSSDGVHPRAEWTVVSYDLLRSPPIAAALAEQRFDLIVVDESHFLKTTGAQRTRAVFGENGLANNCGAILCLTGTPLPNRPRECMTANTLVLTSRGWVPIISVAKNDLLWDGEEWVKHDGLLFQGCEKTVSVDGISATGKHLLLGKYSWVSAGAASQNTDILRQLLERGSRNLPSPNFRKGKQALFSMLSASALAEEETLEQLCRDYELAGALDVELAEREKARNAMLTCARMTLSEKDYRRLCRTLNSGVITQRTLIINPTAAEGSKFTGRGFQTAAPFWAISFPSKDMRMQVCSLTGLTMTGDMNPAISGGRLEGKTWKTDELFTRCKNELTNWKPVFDIANAGPRNRFTVLGDSGPIISHNCYTIARALDWSSIDFMQEKTFRERFNPKRMIERHDPKTGRVIGRRSEETHGRLPELQARLRANFMVRRLKRDVLDQLPDIRYEIVHTAEDGAIKRALEAEKLLDIDPEDLSGASADTLGHISTVRKMMGVAKAPHVASYVDMLLLGGEEKLVVFGWHIEALDILEQRLHHHGHVRVDGSTSPARRQMAVDRFVEDDGCRVFLGNLKSIGVGVDGLQKVCSHGVFAECSWTPADNDQGVGRLERFGQHNGIFIEFLVAPGSFDERVLQTALKKLKGIHGALDERI